MLKKSGICALLLSAALAIFQPASAAAQQRFSSQQYNQRFVSPRNDRSVRNERNDRRYENERRDFRGGNEWGRGQRYGWSGSSRTYFTPNYYNGGDRNRYRAPQCDRY
jgi:Ni/Co efflux regulator RcnB